MRKRLMMVGMVALLLSPVSCATTSPAVDDTAPPHVTILMVENNLSSFSDVTVYVQPQNGVRSTLGVVRSGSTASFQYAGTGALQFVAQPNTGGEITSERVSVMQPSRIRWALTTNRLTVSAR